MYLRKYETLRQRYNVPMMLAIDVLHRLYRGTVAPIVLARSLGLQITNATPVIKVKHNRFENSKLECNMILYIKSNFIVCFRKH